MSEPRDMIIPMLQDMRASIASIDQKIDQLHADTRNEFAKLDARHKAMRQAMGTGTLMSKFILGDFEERLALLEQRLDQITTKPA